MRQLVEACDFPDFIRLRSPKKTADIRTGRGLDYGEIYFSSFHLQAIQLPLHPLIHYFLYRTNLCPMQLHPNVFRILSCALSINVEYNWEICLSDIFRCFKIIPCRNGKDLYTLSPHEDGGSFLKPRKTNEKGWRDHAIVVGGDWFCDDLKSLPIRSSFGEPADVDLGRFVSDDRVLYYDLTLWKKPGLDPQLLLTREMLKRGREGDLGLDEICQDIFNDLKRLYFGGDESLVYDEVYTLSFNMDKFKTNQFPSVSPPPRKRKRELLKDERPVNPPGSSPLGSGTGSSESGAAKKSPAKKLDHKLTEAEQLAAAKKDSTEAKSNHVQLPTPNYPDSGPFAPNFVGKDGQQLLNTDRPSLDPISACNLMDSIFTDAEVASLADKSDADQEDSCTNAVYQAALYLHGLKQRISYHRQQSATRLTAAQELEKKKRLESEIQRLTRKNNFLNHSLRLEKDSISTLETAIEKMKTDHAEQLGSMKESMKNDLMKDFWARMAEAYRTGFSDGGKSDPSDRYFESPEVYDQSVGVTSVLPPFPEDLVVEDGGENSESAADQVINEDDDADGFTKADQVINENDDADGFRKDLCSKRNRDVDVNQGFNASTEVVRCSDNAEMSKAPEYQSAIFSEGQMTSATGCEDDGGAAAKASSKQNSESAVDQVINQDDDADGFREDLHSKRNRYVDVNQGVNASTEVVQCSDDAEMNKSPESQSAIPSGGQMTYATGCEDDGAAAAKASSNQISESVADQEGSSLQAQKRC